MQRQCGFSLVEILVVLSIISILVAITVPAIMDTRSEASKAACARNLQGISQATMSFHMSVTRGRRWPANESLYPRATQLLGLASIESLFQGANPILSSTEILQCPENTNNVANEFDDTFPKAPWSFDIGDSSYLWNIVAPQPDSELSRYYFAADRVTNHIDGINVLHYGGNVEFYDQDLFPETVEDWEQGDSRILKNSDGSVLLQP